MNIFVTHQKFFMIVVPQITVKPDKLHFTNKIGKTIVSSTTSEAVQYQEDSLGGCYNRGLNYTKTLRDLHISKQIQNSITCSITCCLHTPLV